MTGPRKAYLNQATQQCTIDQTPLWPDAPNTPFPGEFGFAKTIDAPLILKVDTSFSEEKIAEEFSNDDIDNDGPKCPYKDFDLIFVAHCENPALGDGALLELTAKQSQALRKDELELQKKVKNYNNNADKGREDIAHEILGGADITEVWRMRAQKYTYVRSDKLKNHKRTYKVDVDKIKKDATLFLEKDEVDPQTGEKKKVRTKILNKEKVKEMFAPKIKQVIEGKTQGSLARLFGESVDAWVDGINNSLKVSRDTKGLSEEEINWDYNAGAQLMRYYASAEAGFEFDLAKLEINAKAEGKAKIALAEGYASSNIFVPHKAGWHAEMMVQKTKVDFGYFRAQLTFEASGMIGASILGSAQIGMGYNEKKGKVEIIPIKPSENLSESGAQASFKAFAGIEAGGQVKGVGEWKNPESKDGKYKELLAIGVGLKGSLGIGAGLDFYITLSPATYRLMFRAKVSATLGWGGGGDLAGTIGFGAIIEFIQFVYHQLNNNNFSYLEFMNKSAFNAHIAITLYIIEEVNETIQWSSEKLEEVMDYYEERSNNQVAGEKLAQKILKNPDILRFTSPEAKGALLYTLSHTDGWPTLLGGSNEEKQEEAIMEVLSWCQTVEEFNKTLQRIDPMGMKTSKDEDKARAKGIDILTDILDWTDETKFNRAVKNTKVFVNKNADKFIIDSFDGSFHKQPYRMQPIQKRNRFA